jgi:hypothetical protein
MVPNSAIRAIVLDVVNQTEGVDAVDDALELRPEAFEGPTHVAAQN